MLKIIANLKSSSRYKACFLVGRRFAQNKGAVVGLAIVFFFFFIALFAPVLAPFDPIEQHLEKPLVPLFTDGYFFGSDDLGRDILSKVIYGARVSLVIGIASVFFALLVSIIVGLLSGYYGGLFDRIVMRVVDIMLAFPFILLTIVIVSVLGPSLINSIIAIAISNIPGYIRVVRSSVIAEKNENYVMADKAIGAPDFYIMFQSILPNSLTPIFVQATMGIGGAILSAAALSFLGMGAQPPTPEWGLMIADGQAFLSKAPWMATIPGVSILLIVVGFNLFSDGIRDIMDPKLKE